MYKVISSLLTLLLFTINICFADEYFLDRESKYQSAIMETGFRLLNCNNINSRMTFFYVPDNKTGVKINQRQKGVYIYKGSFLFLDDENELAALLSLNVGHLLDVQAGFFRRFSISFSPRKYEVKADKKAVDLMVKAGYDPVALITLINKAEKEQLWFEYNIFHHNGSERVKNIYHYIYEKYPIYLADNKYLTNQYYQNFLRTTKKDRRKVRYIQEEKIRKENKEKLRNF